jgi:WD40-like Beta Propeller Repeat
VSSGRLHVLDGSLAGQPATLHPVAAPAGAMAPAWSPDGRWLAFIVAPPAPYPVVSAPSGTLWLARTDGNDARPVLATAGPFSWSPAADVLAATLTDPATGRTQACEFQPGATPRLLPGVTGSAIWSPDGRQLAFTRIQSSPQAGFTGSMLEAIPAAGGTPAVRARSAQNALIAAGWWPDSRGLLAWSDPQDSASLAADGVPLVSYPLSGTRPVTLATTLVHPSFLATTPSLGLVAADAGGDRILRNGKTIVLCAVTGGCTGFPGGIPGPVNLDPAWSPAGSRRSPSCTAPRPPQVRRGSARPQSWPGTRPAGCGSTFRAATLT